MASNQGYGLTLAFGNRLFLPLRFELALFWMTMCSKPQMCSSLHWNLSLPPVIDYTSPIVTLLAIGDVEGIKDEFSSRRATPFDTFVDGTTLLHVRGS